VLEVGGDLAGLAFGGRLLAEADELAVAALRNPGGQVDQLGFDDAGGVGVAVQQEHRRAGLQLVVGVPSGDAPHQHVGAGDCALAGDGWVLEPKWDGIRAIAHVA
jgi:hypothetical protein